MASQFNKVIVCELADSYASSALGLSSPVDRVEATTQPNQGRQGVVTIAQKYWITVKADWTIVGKDGKRKREFTKARHNLRRL